MACEEDLNVNKYQSEYQVSLARRSSCVLKIRFVSGMEMLAQELATGNVLFDPDWQDLPPSPLVYSPVVGPDGSPLIQPSPMSPWGSPFSPWGSPFSPDSPMSPASPTGPIGPQSIWLPIENEYDEYEEPLPDPRTGSPYGVARYPSEQDYYGACQDLGSPLFSPVSPWSPGWISPCCSPESPPDFPTDDPEWFNWAGSPVVRPTTRRRSQHHTVDSTRAFPVLFIEEDKVCFYSTRDELETLLKEQSEDGVGKLILNLSQIVSIEKVISYESFAQNTLFNDVVGSNSSFEDAPEIAVTPLDLHGDLTIPLLRRPEDEMFLRIPVVGGVQPYRFSIMGQPSDLYVTTDGWIRGFIEEHEWPVRDPLGPEVQFREFRIRIIVEDASIPVQTVSFDFRYRLYAL